jgi:hypothetical protein
MRKKKTSTLTSLTLEQFKNLSVQVPNLPVMYFNHSRVALSSFDVRIYFGQGNITAQGEQSLVEQLCVILTPEYAAAFSQTLKATLEKYEELFGKIRPPSAPMLLQAAANMKATEEVTPPTSRKVH